MKSLKNPEMRQFHRTKILNDNCRPSGLYGFPRESKDSTKNGKIFSIKTISDITPNGAIKRWVALSSGRRSALLRYFFLKFIYDELTKEEYNFFLSFKEITEKVPIFFALRARRLKIPKRIIRKILEEVQFPGFKIVTREEYIGMQQIRFSFEKKNYPPIKKPKPYSGYSKGFKDGRRRSKFQIDEFDSSPLEPSPNFEDEINILLDFAQEISRHPRKLKELSIIIGDIE